jgi:uncharacterized protein YqgC (DUF456 family)
MMHHLDSLWWTLVVLLMLAGIAGNFVPMMPDTVLVLAGAVVHKVTLDPDGTIVSWWTIAGLFVLMVISYVIDFVSGAIGAKYFGATRLGAIGGVLGAIVGMFFFPIGLFVGPIVGVLLGEIIGGKELIAAGKSTWGTVLGTTAGIVVKLGITVVMIGWFVLAVLL